MDLREGVSVFEFLCIRPNSLRSRNLGSDRARHFSILGPVLIKWWLFCSVYLLLQSSYSLTGSFEVVYIGGNGIGRSLYFIFYSTPLFFSLLFFCLSSLSLLVLPVSDCSALLFWRVDLLFRSRIFLNDLESI